MDHCTVETGLLRKKPCGQNAVTHCANCEQPLCATHAVAQMNEAGKKSGKFMCKECDVAQREYAKTMAAIEKDKAKAAPGAPAAAPKPAAAPAAAAGPKKEAPAAPKPEEKKNDGGIDFTPTKK